MLERTDAITNGVLEPITFVIAYPTLFVTQNAKHVFVKFRPHVQNANLYTPSFFTSLHKCI